METKRPFELNSFETNDHETEQNFRETCLWYEDKFSDYHSCQAYQKYINNYHKAKSLYFITKFDDNKAQMAICDTESGREEFKILKIPKNWILLLHFILLLSGELFCFYKTPYQENALIIDSNYEVRFLPSGLPLFRSSAIYFNANVYCFGGRNKSFFPTTASRKFDLNRNRWINLTPMPKKDFYCHSVIFNENILICGNYSKNLFLYAIDIDSFSKILYEFSYNKRKILINAERLYLIEMCGFIYESDINNEYAWNKISNSEIYLKNTNQVHCVYNKGEIYISVESSQQKKLYYKFDLKQRIMHVF